MRRLAALSIVLLSLTACSPEVAVVPEEDSGSTVTIELGQELRVELYENASVGYTWEVTTDPDPAVLAFVGEDYVPDDPDTDGGGGRARFRWTGTGPGTTELAIARDYRGEGVDRTFRITVVAARP